MHVVMIRNEYMQQHSLADYVNKIMLERELSGYAVEKRSRGEITQSYVNRIKNGEAKNPSADKLKGLAKGLGVTEEEVFRVARGAADTSGDSAETLQIIKGVSLQLDRSVNLSNAGKQKILDTVRWITEGVLAEENQN